MNYAEDRADRRARHDDQEGGFSLLCRDYREAFSLSVDDGDDPSGSVVSSVAVAVKNHSLLAKTLRDLGWNRQALFHFGRAWMDHPADWEAAADYCQMAELAGAPELGMMAAWVYRTAGRMKPPPPPPQEGEQTKLDRTTASQFASLSSWLAGQTEPPCGHCGCGSLDCGGGGGSPSSPFFVPFESEAVDHVLSLLETFLIRHHHSMKLVRTTSSPIFPNANAILGHLATKTPSSSFSLDPPTPERYAVFAESIPLPLQFWKGPLGSGGADGAVKMNCTRQHQHQGDNNLRPLPTVFQLLLIKLLYVTIPSLAAHAVVLGASFFDSGMIAEIMARDYKSHWAYYVLIRTVLLGRERIKTNRRHSLPYYHVPVWDLLWKLDYRRDYYYSPNDGTDDSDGDGAVLAFNKKKQPVASLQLNNNAVQDDTGLVLDDAVRESLRQLRRSMLGSTNDPHCCLVSPPFYIPPTMAGSSARRSKPLLFVGDSHVLSLAWQQLWLAGQWRLVVPIVVTGLKAWHVRTETRFFTQSCWQTVLHRIQQKAVGRQSSLRSRSSINNNDDDDVNNRSNCRRCHRITIVVSAGEIDCREGLGGPLLEGYTGPYADGSCRDSRQHIQRTVDEYVTALEQLVVKQPQGTAGQQQQQQLQHAQQHASGDEEDTTATKTTITSIAQILVMPVPPHLQMRKGRIKGRAVRRETTRQWNQELRTRLAQSRDKKVYFLDYESAIVDENSKEYVLKPILNADSTHMNAAFAPHLERAVMNCGCSLDLL